MLAIWSVPWLAVATDEVEFFPLGYQLVWILAAGLFVWTFCIVRHPRSWRRLYQAKFSRGEEISVNRNKQIDEQIKRYGIIISMAFLVVAVTAFLMGITHRHRHTQREMTKVERFRANEMEKLGGK
jgi:hypothetical protein